MATDSSVWVSKLANATLNALPADFVSHSVNKVVESSHFEPVSSSASNAINTLAKKNSTSPQNVGAAIFATLLYRLVGDEEIVFGSETKAESPAISRCTFTPETTISQVIENVAEFACLAQSSKLDLHSVETKLQSQLFRALFLGHTTSSLDHRDLTLQMDLEENKLRVYFNSLLFKQQRIVFFAQQFLQVAEALAENPSLTLSRVSLVTQDMSSILPNPRKDLEWSSFRGAIHDIFQENATKFPNRTCVVETANPLDASTSTRTFSYRQINEASNQVAHYLRHSGIVNDDVVMIYAYRGVDLVASIMGVLKAGATFSVIDPAYPPQRQNIYLSVAKPRGLIVLRKAGTLSSLVEEYVSNELNVVCSLRDLELDDEANLQSRDNALESVAELKSEPTHVIVGPDSHPTLSFTSGSEGVPKGVRGRHFSLTYYFPWMAETFGLSDKDRFTMLSGISHDPIQRDIFTPLFLGAQLLVPCADDIGTPGRLAEWMAENNATVTHLTPAMGQLLSAQATTTFESLHHAFFVGDILTTRDCVRLQALAQNANIVNMYGTTETQRAVSYFEIPSINSDPTFLQTQKDTIPAGRGMKNVQMLVVNRNDSSQICGVGEVGEIYVRAAGLSDGYLDLPDMTAAKFVTNWFVGKDHWKSIPEALAASWADKYWLGPRDRLYRSGDLGRYLPDGNTECCGRADDQIKIRGFRIELGEINTHLSRHAAVRENVTLVRRDKDEEPTLVAYIVPKSSNDEYMSAHESLDEDEAKDPVVTGLVRYRRLIKSIKEFLKTKLPSYAVPSVIIPLQRLPLNPNGKIDKPRLPFPDTAQLQVVGRHIKNDLGSTDALNDLEVRVRDLWVSVLSQTPPSVEPSDTFFDLGGHSILATKMVFQARKEFGIPELPLGTIYQDSSLRGFAKAIEGLQQGESLLIQESVEKPQNASADKDLAYGEDADRLLQELPEYKRATKLPSPDEGVTVFVTGGTGFLGSFIINDLLSRPNVRILAHVRAKDMDAGLERLRSSGRAYGVWDEKKIDRVEVVLGDLDKKHFGLDVPIWTKLCNSIDVVIHNAALVHWVYPYETLRAPNVLGTINTMNLCTQGKEKTFTFVSSTSVLDTPHYIELSDQLTQQGRAGVPESDSLEGSRSGLGSGYGQSKWVGEYLVRGAGRLKNLRGSIVRPGYVTGDSKAGICNTDDFLVRMIKGCQELGLYPNIVNTVNMVPVDHVARVTVAAALNPEWEDVSVVQITSHPRLLFKDFLGSLGNFGFNVRETEYLAWRIALEKYVTDTSDSALFPLLHFVLDNLPQNTKAPELDDANAVSVLSRDFSWTKEDVSRGSCVDVPLLHQYFEFLIACGFLQSPPDYKPSYSSLISEDVLENFSQAGGRTK